ncbi:hypothetical protein GCM10009433_12840 [Psychroflexus lacisalsi]|uniref:Glycoside hydrolase n=2 Tax=Psychroflexus lacisalsi TaxID=503928 RepID=A0ABP3VEX8_9FLAO
MLNNFLLVFAQDKSLTKINGMSMVASRSTINDANAKDLRDIGSNYIAVMPYAFMPKAEKAQLFFDTKRQWIGETLAGIESDVETLQALGLKVMIKPHIWIASGAFTGNIAMTSEEDWIQFEENYKAYILAFASMAEKNKVSLFCLGTELNSFVSERTEFWCELIEEVKSIYSGKLTYAENWDKYDDVIFWDSLDYIGIDAYFPISENKTPSVEKVNFAWHGLKSALKSFSKDYNSKILFTEYGYRSIDYAGKEPWESSRKEVSGNETAQLNLLKGLHQSIWDEDWFAGGFLWKWFPNYNSDSNRHHNRFTTQGKISESYLKSFFKKI